MDETTNPLMLPEAYDVFVLAGDPFSKDGEASPGKSTLTSGGDRTAKIEGMQSPGESGATTTDRGDELGSLSYLIEVWTLQQLPELSAYRNKLRQAQKRKGGRRKVLELIDLRLEDQDYDRVLVQRVTPIKTLAPTRWGFEVGFSEYKPRVARGGPVKPTNAEAAAKNRDDAAMGEQVKKDWEELDRAVEKADRARR